MSPEVRRGQIIQAALNLFSTQGFARTTTKDIAAAAGISEGTIYNYFSSKEDLLVAFVKTVAFDTLSDLLTSLEDADDRTAFEAILLDRMHVWEGRFPIMKVVVSEAICHPELARQLIDNLLKPGTRLLDSFLRRRILRGGLRCVDGTLVVRVMIGMAIAAFMENSALTMGGKRKPLEILAREVADILLYGISRTRPRAVAEMPKMSGSDPKVAKAVMKRKPKKEAGR